MKLCDEVETVREFTCVDDRVKFEECGELHHEKLFPMKLKAIVCKGFFKPGDSVWEFCMMPKRRLH